MKTMHTDRHGNKTPLSQLETSHLRNIIRSHNRIAREGLTVRRGGGSSPDDFWYDEEEYFGQDALNQLQTDAYVKELESRAAP